MYRPEAERRIERVCAVINITDSAVAPSTPPSPNKMASDAEDEGGGGDPCTCCRNWDRHRSPWRHYLGSEWPRCSSWVWAELGMVLGGLLSLFLWMGLMRGAWWAFIVPTSWAVLYVMGQALAWGTAALVRIASKHPHMASRWSFAPSLLHRMVTWVFLVLFTWTCLPPLAAQHPWACPSDGGATGPGLWDSVFRSWEWGAGTPVARSGHSFCDGVRTARWPLPQASAPGDGDLENYAGLASPESPAEVLQAVEWAWARDWAVLPWGHGTAGGAWWLGPNASAPTLRVDVGGLRPPAMEPSFNATSGESCAPAGWSLGEWTSWLEQFGRWVPGMGGFPHSTVGGCVAQRCAADVPGGLWSQLTRVQAVASPPLGSGGPGAVELSWMTPSELLSLGWEPGRNAYQNKSSFPAAPALAVVTQACASTAERALALGWIPQTVEAAQLSTAWSKAAARWEATSALNESAVALATVAGQLGRDAHVALLWWEDSSGNKHTGKVRWAPDEWLWDAINGPLSLLYAWGEVQPVPAAGVGPQPWGGASPWGALAPWEVLLPPARAGWVHRAWRWPSVAAALEGLQAMDARVRAGSRSADAEPNRALYRARRHWNGTADGVVVDVWVVLGRGAAREWWADLAEEAVETGGSGQAHTVTAGEDLWDEANRRRASWATWTLCIWFLGAFWQIVGPQLEAWDLWTSGWLQARAHVKRTNRGVEEGR